MDDDTRAETALRRALSHEADAFEPGPLEPRTDRRRRGWLVPVAAAAAAVLVVGGGLVATGVLGDDEPAEDDPPVVVASGGGDVRTVWWRDVALDVPADWQDGAEPTTAWCAAGAGETSASGPYVARGTARYVPAILCPQQDDGRPEAFGPAPQNLWAPHVTFADAATSALADGAQTFDGWTIEVRTVGEVQLQVWSDASTAEVADAVLASARTFVTDPNGCDTRSQAQSAEQVRPAEPSDLTRLTDVDDVAVCLYDRTRGDGVGLVGSRTVSGADADALLAAFRAAPVGGGPDDPASCTTEHEGDSAVLARFRGEGGVADVLVYFDWCFGNGLDDGTTRRALTEDTCAPLFGGPVRWVSVSGVVAPLCD